MESTKTIALLISLAVLASLFFIVLIALITVWSKRKLLEKEKKLHEIKQQQQIELFKAVIDAEETQKTEIAGNLHDQIMGSLTLKAMNLSVLIEDLEKGGQNFEGLRTEVEDLIKLRNEIRDIVYGLIPEMFTFSGLIKSIELRVKELNIKDGSKAIFNNNTNYIRELPFSQNQQLNIYRICLEILNNLKKHAHYSYLTVTIENLDGDFSVVFAHDGISITNEDIAELTFTSSGIGLKSLQSRVLLLNADIDYSKEKDVSLITLHIPVKK